MNIANIVYDIQNLTYQCFSSLRFTSRGVAAMFVKYQLPMVEVVLVLVLVLVVDKTSQTISGGFVPSLNVTVNQWNGENFKYRSVLYRIFGEMTLYCKILPVSCL